MADDLKPIGFLSYARSDDRASGGRISAWRVALEQHLQLQIGRGKVQIFQDRSHLEPGTAWRRQIDQRLRNASFLVAVVTPAFLQSDMCAQEVLLFREREQALGREDLIVPVHYIDTEAIEAEQTEAAELTVLRLLRKRQWPISVPCGCAIQRVRMSRDSWTRSPSRSVHGCGVPAALQMRYRRRYRTKASARISCSTKPV